jgi:imidazolonepropionase
VITAVTDADLILTNIGELVTVDGRSGPRCGSEMRELGIVRDAAVAASGGIVIAAGRERDVLDSVDPSVAAAVIDVGRAAVTPGLVDPHTHAVFAETRENEFAMRVAGRSYEEIAAAGGGIRSSVRALRAASRESLLERARETLDTMLAYGTTTVEVKSGYGLSLESELSILRVVAELSASHVVDVVPTFLGAHEVPDEWRADRNGYVDHVIGEMIPAVADEGLARFCDVFCEDGVFSVGQARRILECGKTRGMVPKVHADELHSSGGAELAASVGAASADHLVCVSDDGVRALADAKVTAVLLPGTTLSLGKLTFAPARKLIDAGVPVALATDCNPGSSMTESMQIIMSLASMALGMTPEETIVAATANAAAAIRLEGSAGAVSVGKPCDLVVWKVDDYRAIPYHYGVNLARLVVKRGRVVATGDHA